MIVQRLACALALMGASAAAATPPTVPGPPHAPPPKLMIVISVDQFSSDLFDEYSPQLLGGLGRIASGVAFRNGYQSHAATETCPGHSTILTGRHPAGTGIIGNLWTDQSAARADKNVYCAEDERVPGSTSTSYTVSPEHLRVPTLGDLLKKQSPSSRNVAVAGKDRAAVMMSGHSADQRWYWTGKAFATDLKVPTPAAVTATNAAVATAIAKPREALESPPVCSAKAQLIPLVGRAPVGNGAFARAAGDTAAFRASPEADGAVLALAAALIKEMRLGRGPTTDLLSIGLSATDYVGHSFGTGGQEMCLQLLSLDRDLGDFLRVLDSQGLDYAIALTADHGGLDIPERLRLKGVADAARSAPSLNAPAIGKAIGAKLTLDGPILLGDVSGDVYIDRALSTADRKRVLAAALEAYRAQPQVEAVLTREEIAATPMPTGSPVGWTLPQRARASYDPDRSGDFVVMLKKNITPIAMPTTYISTHGSPWDYDRRVPILFWSRDMARLPQEAAIETTDIMPTLAALLQLSISGTVVDGRCLDGLVPVICPVR